MRILDAESTDLFVGSAERPLQVVRVRCRLGDGPDTARIVVRGDGLTTERPGSSDAPVRVHPPDPTDHVTLEVGVAVDHALAPGTRIAATAALERTPDATGDEAASPFEFVVAEPGWTMFMVSHFHYDPVWWNTQAGYTETWGTARETRSPYQEPGLALVKSHLDMARRDPDYKFVLAELDYLKPYWAVYPEDRAYFRQLLAEGRMELMGGTYNEPNTNLTSAETTIRNAVYGVGYQRHVLGGDPQTAWQLDAFGHDPMFPAIMADAGITSSSWARGPFHEWGPHWVRGDSRRPALETHVGEKPRMQFASEFEWVGPSGKGLLTAYMANHYSAGWWMDASATLEEAESEALRLFKELQEVAVTRNVLLPVGTDYTPPNRWVTAIQRDWSARYVWPRFIAALPREFFAAVRAERAERGRGFSPQTRDMNPVYTGKDVSYIDTKQAQRVSENTLLAAEKFATFAGLLGAPYPTEAIDKAWRQLLFGAHHDGITGSESDQVYLDLLGGWRESQELGSAALDGALAHLGRHIDTSGEGWAITVFNPLSWPRTDLAHLALDLPDGVSGVEVLDDAGTPLPALLEHVGGGDGVGRSERHVVVTFLARDVPALGYRTFRLRPADGPHPEAAWREVDGRAIENDAYALEVDPERGGAIVSLVEKGSGTAILRPGGLANELLVYGEHPNHPHFGEGPWHLIPDGSRSSSAEQPADVTVEECPIGRRIRISGPFDGCRRRQDITLWDGLDRIEFATTLDGFSGQDRLFRVRFQAGVEGGTPISEVGNAVIGRPFGFPNVDVAKVPFTLDEPAYDWFGLGTTARVDLVDAAGSAPRASRAFGVAEVLAPGEPTQDAAVRALVVALVRQGVTSTLSRHDGSRYGTLDLDSNLPDVRISIGGPDRNEFTRRLFEEAGGAYSAELQRQIDRRGWARVWVPAARPITETWQPNTDMRGLRQLPTLVVAGSDDAATIAAVEAVAADLADATIAVEQPPELDGTTGRVDDRTVAILNRGTPGFNVEPDGSLYLSLMRSCSGWPSGVWIDPPVRTVPDGSNFQFQHWSHTFEYALVGCPGDWRSGRVVNRGHEYDQPFITRRFDAHPGELPANASFVSIEPPTAILTALKPAGQPMARMAPGVPMDAAAGITMRVYESVGSPVEARIRSIVPLRDAAVNDLLEEARDPLEAVDGSVRVALDAYATATISARPDRSPAGRAGPGDESSSSAPLAPRAEPAQPVFADYWMHNRGASPMGYQPVTVQIRPGLLRGRGPFDVPVVVASERTDGPAAGTVTIAAPPGWQSTPAERVFRLAPGAHLDFSASVSVPADAKAGRYFVAARISDEIGQVHEDVVTIDLDPSAPVAESDDGEVWRSVALGRAVERAMRRAGLPPDTGEPPAPSEFGGELEAAIVTRPVRVVAGERDEIRVALRNVSAAEIRGEAQIISPHETWPALGPWSQGFAVPAGAEATLRFTLAPPPSSRGGSYWALVKVMYFGRLIYTESVPIEIVPAARTTAALAGAAARP